MTCLKGALLFSALSRAAQLLTAALRPPPSPALPRCPQNTAGVRPTCFSGGRESKLGASMPCEAAEWPPPPSPPPGGSAGAVPAPDSLLPSLVSAAESFPSSPPSRRTPQPVGSPRSAAPFQMLSLQSRVALKKSVADRSEPGAAVLALKSGAGAEDARVPLGSDS